MARDPMPGYDAWRTRTPWDDIFDHLTSCPMHEDNHDGEPAECECPTKAELEAERAEARADAERDR